MVRQWFSISAVLATAALMIACDASQARERRFRRWRGNYDNSTVMTSTQGSPGTEVTQATEPTQPTESVAVRQRRFGRRYTTYPATQTATVSGTDTRQAFYPPAGRESPVLLTLRVPAQAEILFDGEKTMQKGALRTFISPPLSPDGKYAYEIKANWTEDGQPRSDTRKVDVRAGQNLTVDFTKPVADKTKTTR
jgi:uncharacterized protein (TIGR03000 family)